ncbi:jg9997 [Pararge aegeria aegeria]|uniref:Jg9997 protein n=1 Tax=Pararge aegeria aegeria TaxID=348720 RepID=A0A8S4SDE9_9NEOP|nr:jg9997 [Pararge aegeria aegeria]
MLTYAVPAWYALASEPNKKTLRAQQAIPLRKLANAPRYVRNSTIKRDLRIDLDDFIARLAQAMFSRADVSEHPQFQNITPWHSRPPEPKGPSSDFPPCPCGRVRRHLVA